MDQLKQAIEELREARQSYESLLREHAVLTERLSELSDKCNDAEERMKACEAQCTAIVREMASDEIPTEFR